MPICQYIFHVFFEKIVIKIIFFGVKTTDGGLYEWVSGSDRFGLRSKGECYGRKNGKETGGEFFGSSLSVKLHALFSRFFGKQGLRSNRATKELIKKLEEFNPDIINLHNIHGYYLNYKILYNTYNIWIVIHINGG